MTSPRDTWLEIVRCVMRPARPELARSLAARAAHLASQKVAAEQRALVLAACERRIEGARTAVFAAGDGVVSARMTELEREWRRLSRRDPDAGLMDLWASVAPRAWIDRKRWRDAATGTRLDVALLLAADPAGVEAAEAAAVALRAALAGPGGSIGPLVRWQLAASRPALMTALLEARLREARAIVTAHRSSSAVFERAQRLERAVAETACTMHASRPELASDLAHAAFCDEVWRASRHLARGPGRLPAAPGTSPIPALHALWRTGHGIARADASGITLEVAALRDDETAATAS